MRPRARSVFAAVCDPHPEEPAEGGRLEGWATGGGPSFETRTCGALLRTRSEQGATETARMFDGLSEKLSGILDRLISRGALSAADVDAAAREVRRALLEADVALDVVRAFVDKLRERAVVVEVIKSVSPGQMVVKIVHDQLVEMLGSSADPIDLNAPAPVPIMMVGLQGSGKTT